MLGQGLRHLLTSPMAGGQRQQFPDPTDMVGQVMEQFEEWLRKRQQSGGQVALGGGQGIQQPAQPSIQAPVGMPPRESAGGLREATGEGAATFMQQAGEEAAQPWKPQALDIGLMAASIALPIIAAMQPAGRGRRGLRKQQRMSELFKGLGGFAQQGLGMRMESFGAGKEATYRVAETRAKGATTEAQAKYDRTISGIEAAESGRRWGTESNLAERGMAVRERPKAGKAPTWSDLKLKGFGGLSGQEQRDALYPGLKEPKATGQLTENQREKNRQQNVLNRANEHLYSLDPKMRERAGIGYDITSFASLAEAAQALANYKEPTGLFGWGEGQAAPDSTLYDLMIEYMGQDQSQGQPGLDEIEAELARRQIGAGR